MKRSKILIKLNNHLLNVLKATESLAKEELEGFVKMEHSIQFDLFPGSLLVNCYFESHDMLDKNKKHEKRYQKKLSVSLLKHGIKLKEPKNNLHFLVVNK